MKKSALNMPVPIIFLLLIVVPLSAIQENKLQSLTLEDCIVKAMRNNLRVAVEEINPDIAEAALMQAKEQFYPSFDLSVNGRKNENPSYWWIQGSDTVNSDYRDYSFAVYQKIPTGGNLSVSLNSYRSETNEAFQLINPRYGSTLQLDFTQPLLRNFGFKMTRKEILLAGNNQEISRRQFETVVMDTLYLVQEAYWNLVYAIEDHKVKLQSLELARDLLAKNKKEVEVGRIAQIEVLNAQAVVATREADILQSETLIRKMEDQLRTLMNVEEEEAGILGRLVPTTEPRFVQREISLEEAISTAELYRPDLKIYAKTVESRELDLSVAKNQMLPDLNLTFSYWSPGVSGDRVLYLDDNPFAGVIVGTQKGSPADSLRDAFKQLYNNWQIGLTLNIPLSTVLSRANLVKARMELDKSRLERENNRKQALLEVRDAVRDIQTNAKRVEAYRVARELAQQRLDAEVKKLNVGLTTNYFVLQYQEELASARSNELKALVDYNLALARLEKAQGTSLEANNIKLADF